MTVGFDVNDSIIMCFNELGCGEAALNKFSAIMGIPGFAHTTYQRLSQKVGRAQQEIASGVLSAAAVAVHQAYADHGMDNDTENEPTVGEENDSDAADRHVVENNERLGLEDHVPVRDVSVSFDGSWHKRGFTSNYGVGIVIDVTTGLALDFEVLSKHCQACSKNEKINMTEGDRLLWRMEHAQKCSKNYDGSSKGMEREAAVRMWGRSIERNKMRYTSMLSDGDSVAFKAVSELGIYPVTKLECINHLDKRFGTALRKKAKEGKLGGRRHGALTAKACNVLQSYYRNSVVKNLNDQTKMKDAIWASFLHCSSSDEHPQHENCPVGHESWCFYQKALARGENPPMHKENIGTPLAPDVATAIRPIYERMTDDTLLARIQHGRTQNANESLNGQIWAKCPKTIHVGLGRVQAAVASAVSQYNQGYSHLSQVLCHLGVTSDRSLRAYQSQKDCKRCTLGDKTCRPETKRARRAKGQQKKTQNDRQERHEGPTYGPGLLGVE